MSPHVTFGNQPSHEKCLMICLDTLAWALGHPSVPSGIPCPTADRPEILDHRLRQPGLGTLRYPQVSLGTYCPRAEPLEIFDHRLQHPGSRTFWCPLAPAEPLGNLVQSLGILTQAPFSTLRYPLATSPATRHLVSQAEALWLRHT